MGERSRYPGFLIPDGRWTADSVDADRSSFTEAGPLPPVFGVVDGSAMLLEAGGAGSDDGVEVLVRQPGAPGPDGARVAVRAIGATDWEGHDPPVVISARRALDYDASGSWRYPVTVRASERVIAAFESDGRYVRCWRLDEHLDHGGEVEIYDGGTSSSLGLHPALAYDADEGAVYLAHVVKATSSAATVRIYRSTDDGQTWAIHSRAALAEYVDTTAYAFQRLRLAVDHGRALLVAWVTSATAAHPEVLLQWASSDGLSTFVAVDEWTGEDEASSAGPVDVAAHAGVFYVVALQEDTASASVLLPYLRRVSSPYEPISSAGRVLCQAVDDAMRWGSLTAGNVVTSADVAVAVDEAGAVWVLGRDVDDAMAGHVRASFDGGDTWVDERLGTAAGTGFGPTWWRGADVATYPKGLAAAWLGGTLVVAHIFAASPGTAGGSACALTLGGWTTMELPASSEVARPYERSAPELTWLPFDLPEDTGTAWARTDTGSPAVAIDVATGAMEIVQSAGEAVSWEATPTAGALAHGVWAEVLGAADSGGFFVEVRAGASGDSYTLRVSVSGSTLTVRDMVAGADVTTVDLGAEDLIHVRVHVANSATSPANNGAWTVMWKAPRSLLGSRTWRVGASGAALQKGALSTNTVRFGTTTGAAEVYLDLVQCAGGEHAGRGYVGRSYPEDLAGRALSASFMDTPITGVTLRGVSGPGTRGEVHRAPAVHTYGLDRIFPTATDASPARGWRSTSDGTGQTITLTATTARRGASAVRAFGLHLEEINFGAFEVWLEDTAGTMTKWAEVDTTAGQSGIAWARSGNTWRPSSTAVQSGAFHYRFGELAGARLVMDNGVGRVVRRIVTNAEGVIRPEAQALPVALEIDDVDASDPTSGTAGAIVPRRVTLIILDAPALKAVRLVIPAQETAEGYHTIGKMVVGRVAVLARPYSRDRDRGWVPGTALVTTPGGARMARVESPIRPYVEVGWADGATLGGAYGSAPTPEAVPLAANGAGVASYADTPYQVVGILEALEGAAGLGVYLADIPTVEDAEERIVINGPRRSLYGRVVSESVVISAFAGEEVSSEAVRVSRLRWEGEL